MGCSASRLDHEDTVRRCRERRRLIKDAVESRHHLASAHSDYLGSLRRAGSALTVFARGEPLPVSDRTPPILLPSPIASSNLPPPPLPRFSPSPTVASSRSKIRRARSVSSAAATPTYKPSVRKTAPPKYPHIPSAYQGSFTTTPSHSSSSVWDWDNIYPPPSPPDSEYFDRLKREQEEREREEYEATAAKAARHHHLPEEDDEEEEEEEREEVQCSEWGDQYSAATSSSSSAGGSDDEAMEGYMRSEGIGAAARSEYGGSSSETRSRAAAPSEFGSKTWRNGPASEAGSDGTVGGGGMSLVVRHRDLAEIVAALEEYFVKAAAAGDPVSELLECGRAQLERSFRQLKKTVYHSNSVLSTLSSTWTSKPPLAIKYRLDTGALEESGGGKSHGSTLERLLAWEKKLYEEVKAREGVKIEHEKKLKLLQSQEYKGRRDEKLDKTKASINKLQSLIMVTSQAVSTTSSAILKVRDNELAPQLVDMCYGFLNMWRLMNQFHEIQNHIVQQVRGLIDRANTGAPTSDLHRVATRDLESAVSAWHSSFNRLIKYQREYIRSLHGWLRLTLLPVSSDTSIKDYSSPVANELTAFCDEWKQALDRLPDTVASEAIKSFINIVHVISTKQAEELKIKKHVNIYSKELEKKSAALRNIEKKFYQSYSMVGIGLPSESGDTASGQVFDTRDPLVEKKIEIAACRRKVEDEEARYSKAVEVTRSLTLNNIQTGLPGVFQAMTGFSGMFVEALQGVSRRAGHLG